MPYDYSSIMTAQWQRLDAEAAEQAAELEAGRHAEDPHRVNYAAQRILEIDAQRTALAHRANQFVAQQQAPIVGGDDLSKRDRDLCRHYRLSPDDLAVAKGWTADDRIPDTQRIEEYLRNKQRYQHARASGEYRDDQGMMKR